MRHTFIFFFLFLITFNLFSQEDEIIRIYHGSMGRTGVFDPSNNQLTIKKRLKIVKQVGDSITIEVVNAHKGLYKYAIASETFQIDYALPDLAELTGLLNEYEAALESQKNGAEESIKSASAKMVEKEGEILKLNTLNRELDKDLQIQKGKLNQAEALELNVNGFSKKSIGEIKERNRLIIDQISESYNLLLARQEINEELRADIITQYQKDLKKKSEAEEELNDVTQLKSEIEKLIKDSEELQTAISKTDFTETLNEAYQYSNSSDHGLRGNFHQISTHPLLSTLETKKKDLEDKINVLYKDKSLELSVYSMHINSIFERLEKVKLDYSIAQAPYVFREEIIVKDQAQKVYLSISSLSEKNKSRDVGEQLIEVTIVPFKKRPIELVPVLSMHKSSNVSSFEIKNGVISEAEEDGFSFKPGLLLAMNMLYFGKYREFSLGPALGYSIDSERKFLQNFNVGLLFSFQQKFRIGIGWGMQRHRSALTDSALLGSALPQNQTINDVTKSVGRSTFSINFSLVGLSILNK